MAQNDFVSVTIVTYNSGRFIKRCLESVLAQRYPLKEIVIVDNASTDGTIDILEQFEDRCQIYYNEENVGFAAAQNQAIKLSNGDWVLTLNPDVLLLPNFIQALVDAGQFDSKIGTVCGKLLTMTAHFEIPEKPVVDSTGIYFNPMLRHLDRGSQEVDNGHYLQYEYVFGATAAAALYRRAMIDDISLDGEFFDSDFFVYREDADVAWRAQLMGWKCLYAPYARGYHVRKVLPGNRRALPPEINMHSVKNRFLMRIKNISPDLYSPQLRSPSPRAISIVVMCCLLWEHTSLQGVLVSGAQLPAGPGQAPPDSIQPPRGPRIHGELVPVRARQQTGAQENAAACALEAAREAAKIRADVTCASLCSARAAFPPITADSKPSPKSFPPGWRRAAIRSPSTAASAIREPVYRGVRLQYLPTIRHKYFDTLAHTFVSTLHLLAHRVDVALYCNGANAIFTLCAAPFRHARGAECGWHRAQAQEVESRWPRPGIWFPNGWPRSAPPRWSPTRAPFRITTASARARRASSFRMARRPARSPARARCESLGLEPGRYFLYVSRMEPENHPLEVREAFEARRTPICKLALIGDAPYAHEYIRRVRDTNDPRVVMPGAIYGEGYRELGSHCFAYIHATEVGGTHPALIEAMGRGALVLYRNTPENAEVAGDAGIPFEPAELRVKIAGLLNMSEAERERVSPPGGGTGYASGIRGKR